MGRDNDNLCRRICSNEGVIKLWNTINYEEKYLQEMIDMTYKYYGDNDISNIDFVRHQYFDNPKGQAFITLAQEENNQKIVGQYVVLPMEIRINRENQKCVNSLNTLTDENYRGKGIFTGLAEANFKLAESQTNFCYGVPNPNSYPGFVKKLNFKDIGSVPLYLRPSIPSNIIKNKFNLNKIYRVFTIFDHLLKVKNENIDSAYNLVEIEDSNLYLIDEFWELVKDKYPIMLVRDSNFIKFRYINIPRRKYKIYITIKDNIPVSLIIGRVTEIEKMKSGMIVDFLVLEGEEYSGKILINKIMNDFQRESVDIVGCLISEKSTESKILKKNMFMKCPKFLEPQPFPIILREFNNKIDKNVIENIDNWFFTAGDYDVI